MAKRIARPSYATTRRRRRISVPGPDPGGVRRTVKKFKKRWGL